MNKATPKYTRKALEKIWNMLQEIETYSQLTAQNSDVFVPFIPAGFVGSGLAMDHVVRERTSIIEKLSASKAIAEIAHAEGIKGGWYIRPSLNYKKVFRKYEKQYELASREYTQSQNQATQEVSDPMYEVRYSEKNREITINNFLLKKPDFDSENERFFTYVYANANKRIDTKELNASGVVLKKTLHKVIENLGFTAQLKGVFFDVSKDSVRFKNPVSKSDLNDKGVKYLDL